METITINGREFVRLTDVCDILRHIRSDYPYDDTKKVVSMIANCMFYDEVVKAKTEEEREAARELPGDFVIYKDLGYRNPNGKTRIWFTGFENKKEARATDDAGDAAHFKFRSMADHVAEMLGKDWYVLCVGREHKRIEMRMKAFIDEIISENERTESV